MSFQVTPRPFPCTVDEDPKRWLEHYKTIPPFYWQFHSENKKKADAAISEPNGEL